MDVSFTTRANSRLANFWSRLLLLATQELQIDGARVHPFMCPQT